MILRMQEGGGPPGACRAFHAHIRKGLTSMWGEEGGQLKGPTLFNHNGGRWVAEVLNVKFGFFKNLLSVYGVFLLCSYQGLLNKNQQHSLSGIPDGSG